MGFRPNDPEPLLADALTTDARSFGGAAGGVLLQPFFNHDFNGGWRSEGPQVT